MSGTFGRRMRELGDRVGTGRLVGTVTVDQVYAQYQSESLDLHHPRGGGPKYLTIPTVDLASDHMERIARATLREGGPASGMVDSVRRIADDVKVLAPLDENDLRRSAATRVRDDGRVVHDQPAPVARLTTEQLRAKAARRGRA